MSEHVVWFDNTDVGGPVISGSTMGSLIAVLDACLVTGFNNNTVTSIVVAGGIATATCNAHGYSGAYSKDVRIAGATPAGLNGRKALLTVTTNTFTFDATGISDQTATGTISAKRDSLGWVKEFSGTNKAIYKRTDAAATTMRLRVDDNIDLNPTAASVRMIETATGVDTFTGLAPTDAQSSNGYLWPKGQSGNRWRLVGDSRGFFFSSGASNGALHLSVRFGDFKTFKQGDAYNCLLAGYLSSDGPYNGGSQNPYGNMLGFVASNGTSCIARGFNQTGTAQLATFAGYYRGFSGQQSELPGYPSPVDSGLLINPQVLVVEDAGSQNYCARGIEAGFCQLLARLPFSDLQIIEPVVALPGRKLLALTSQSSYRTFAQFAVDITGPWSY